MKSKQQKRQEAFNRLVKYTWENSKAKRKGTMTQAEWDARQKELTDKLTD